MLKGLLQSSLQIARPKQLFQMQLGLVGLADRLQECVECRDPLERDSRFKLARQHPLWSVSIWMNDT